MIIYLMKQINKPIPENIYPESAFDPFKNTKSSLLGASTKVLPKRLIDFNSQGRKTINTCQTGSVKGSEYIHPTLQK
jgi:hypothetical protein